jgi:hypothetical protein
MFTKRSQTIRENRDRLFRDMLSYPERSIITRLLEKRLEVQVIDDRAINQVIATQLILSHLSEFDTSGQIHYRQYHRFVNRDSLKDSTPQVISELSSNLGLASVVLIAMFLGNRFILGVVFRGGLTWILAGLALVHRNGKPCGRLWCGVRAVVVWIPIMAVSLALIFVQVNGPTWVLTRLFLVITIVVMCIAYSIIAIRNPSRPIQDRIMGTQIVPT